jgi:hypothetical protein
MVNDSPLKREACKSIPRYSALMPTMGGLTAAHQTEVWREVRSLVRPTLNVLRRNDYLLQPYTFSW